MVWKTFLPLYKWMKLHIKKLTTTKNSKQCVQRDGFPSSSVAPSPSPFTAENVATSGEAASLRRLGTRPRDHVAWDRPFLGLLLIFNFLLFLRSHRVSQSHVFWGTQV